MLKKPAVVPFVECPNCKRLLEYGAARCPTCREEIEPEYAYISAVVVCHNTQAVSSANTIKTAEPAAIIIFMASLCAVFLKSPSLLVVNLITPLLSLLAIFVWFYRYGKFKAGDEEYLRAKREMKASLKLWLAVLVTQSLVILYMLKMPNV